MNVSKINFFILQRVHWKWNQSLSSSLAILSRCGGDALMSAIGNRCQDRSSSHLEDLCCFVEVVVS